MKPCSILVLFAVFSLAHVIHANEPAENPFGQFESFAKDVGAGIQKGMEKVGEEIKKFQNKTQEAISKFQQNASNLTKSGLPSLPQLPRGAPPAGAPPTGAPPTGAPPAGAPPAGAPPAPAPPAPASRR